MFSTTAMRSSRAAGPPVGGHQAQPQSSHVLPRFTAWTSTAESCLRSTATIRPLLRTASPLKESAVCPAGIAVQSFLPARAAGARASAAGWPVSQTVMPVLGLAGEAIGAIGAPGPTHPRQGHEECDNSDNRKPTHEIFPCSRAVQETAVLPPPNRPQDDLFPGIGRDGNRPIVPQRSMAATTAVPALWPFIISWSCVKRPRR